jgi:error-prone DNA polymerase
MIAAGFSGGEAEELRRAFGFKRSERRMKDIEKKLRAGMEKKGIDAETQEKIVQSITSFALYGFPESHAASFALLAYASAYLKVHYLAAFTAALLNNQPMGFYRPATIVKDAQRHGLRIRPIDVTCSDWLCTLEKQKQGFAVRLGLRYAKGLREEIGKRIVDERAQRRFASIEDLKLRVPAIQKAELAGLAEIGALNFISGEKSGMHRRDALWQIERAARRPGPLFETPDETMAEMENIKEREIEAQGEGPTMKETGLSRPARRGECAPSTMVRKCAAIAGDHSPLARMTPEERLVADFRGTGMTVGPHPMAYHREEMKRQGIRSAAELRNLRDGMNVRIAGAVIARQRPGTANGFVFLSIEDETGIANAIITPQLFKEDRAVVVQHQFLLIQGKLQNQEGVVSVKAEHVRPLAITRAETASHDFH